MAEIDGHPMKCSKRAVFISDFREREGEKFQMNAEFKLKEGC